MYDGKADSNYIESLAGTIGLLASKGIEYEYLVLNGDPFIDRARDRLAARFLASDSTDLIFLDADVGWQPEAILTLLEHDADVVGGVYPKRSDEVEFPAALKLEDGCALKKCGLLEALMIPTGFMRIQRRVFDGIEASEYKAHGESVFDYFDCGSRDGRYIGEDVNFCLKVIKAGFQLWIQPDIDFTHTGLKVFSGNYAARLKG